MVKLNWTKASNSYVAYSKSRVVNRYVINKDSCFNLTVYAAPNYILMEYSFNKLISAKKVCDLMENGQRLSNHNEVAFKLLVDLNQQIKDENHN